MKPILYPSTERAFDTNGIGVLSDAISCRVVQELNGQYELTLKYRTTGIHYSQIQKRAIILAKPDPISRPQPFRIYRRLPSSKGTIEVYARHIAYDLRKIVVTPFSASGVAAALPALKTNAVIDCPFTFWTDKAAASTMTVQRPRNIWSLLGGSEGSILDRYGGEYEFDRFDVKLWNRRGADRGVSIRYGKNLRTLEQDENCDNCYTGVYPYWCSAEGNLVQLPEKVVYASGTYDHVEILDLDFSEEWETAPTEEQLRARAERYITDNDIGIPNVSWKIEHVALEQTEEYKGMALLERVLLGDTDTVEFPEMNVYASSRVVATDFDVLLERYNSITLGKVKANIASTIAQQNKEIQNKPSQTMVMAITRTLTERITGAKGGIVRIMDTDGDGWPDELYVADNPDPAQAVKVWRFNYEGWAGSKAGYNGPFNLGATLEDGLLADFVRAAHLVAGTIQSADDGETFFLDLSNSILKMKAMDDLQTKVDENQTTTEKRISEVSVKADGVFAEVSQQTQTVENIKEEVAAIQAVAGEVAIRVQSIEDNGVSKVKTQMGYTFDDEGMHVEKEGDEVGSKVNNRGIYVSRGSEVMLQADASGVKATDVTVNNYLIIGHTRYEEFDDGIDSDCTAAFDI